MNIVRKKAANVASNQLCPRLCHAVRAQMCQFSSLGDQTRVLPCGLIQRHVLDSIVVVPGDPSSGLLIRHQHPRKAPVPDALVAVPVRLVWVLSTAAIVDVNVHRWRGAYVQVGDRCTQGLVETLLLEGPPYDSPAGPSSLSPCGPVCQVRGDEGGRVGGSVCWIRRGRQTADVLDDQIGHVIGGKNLSVQRRIRRISAKTSVCPKERR